MGLAIAGELGKAQGYPIPILILILNLID